MILTIRTYFENKQYFIQNTTFKIIGSMGLVSCQKVISANRVSLTTEIREMLGGVNEGDFIMFSQDEDGRIYIKKLAEA